MSHLFDTSFNHDKKKKEKRINTADKFSPHPPFFYREYHINMNFFHVKVVLTLFNHLLILKSARIRQENRPGSGPFKQRSSPNVLQVYCTLVKTGVSGRGKSGGGGGGRGNCSVHFEHLQFF